MNSFWRFLRDKRNQQVLGCIGGGLVFVATGLWAVFICFFPPQKSVETKAPEQPGASASAPINVQTDCSGIAIGGDVTGATITSSAPSNTKCSSKTEMKARP
jgi:hypothetical protein